MNLNLINEEAEQAILGALMIQPNLIYTEELSADMFADGRNRIIYSTIEKLIKVDKLYPDNITIENELKSTSNYDNAGGLDYLISLLTVTPTLLRYTEHAKIVQDKYNRRILFRKLNEIANMIINNDSIEHISRELLDSASNIVSSSRDSNPIKEYASQVYDEIVEKHNSPSEYAGVRTGIVDFDKRINGFHVNNGEVIYLAGEPGIGKTILATQMCLGLADRNIGNCPGVIYSLEMTAKQIIYRMLSCYSKIPYGELDSGKVSDWDNLTNALEYFYKLPIFISDDQRITPDTIRADLKRKIANHDIKWFMVDYLLRLNGYDRYEELERSEKLSRDLVSIAKELNIGAIVINSVTKDAMDENSSNKKSLRGSGQLIHDADIIALLTNSNVHGGNNYRTLKLLKNRNGKANKYIELFMPFAGVLRFECLGD